MKNLFIYSLVFFSVASCENNSNEPAKSEEPTPVSVSGPSFINPIEYSSQFEMSNPKYSEKVVQLWDDFDKNKLDNNRSYFADSVAMDFPGMSFKGSLDSMMSIIKGVRNSMPDVKSKVDAVMCVKSIDKLEDWVLIWGREYITETSGKVDSSLVHEIWRFNDAGKVDYMSQFRREYATHKK